jgi:hypothetical protein
MAAPWPFDIFEKGVQLGHQVAALSIYHFFGNMGKYPWNDPSLSTASGQHHRRLKFSERG